MYRSAYILKSGLDALSLLFLALVMFAIFMIVYIIERHVIGYSIVFYDALVCLGCVALGFALLWLYLIMSGKLDGSRWASWLWKTPQAILLYLFIGYSFAITVPSLLDRSISLYILGLVAVDEKAGLSEKEIDDLFYQGFIQANDAVKKRLIEQVASGNVVEEHDTYKVTTRGLLIYHIHSTLAGLFNTDKRYVVQAHGGYAN